jgi:hypothetical protein
MLLAITISMAGQVGFFESDACSQNKVIQNPTLRQGCRIQVSDLQFSWPSEKFQTASDNDVKVQANRRLVSAWIAGQLLSLSAIDGRRAELRTCLLGGCGLADWEPL